MTSVWFLLFGGVRPVFELQRLRGRGRMPESDAELAHLTPFPALLLGVHLRWVNLFALARRRSLLAGPLLAEAGIPL